MAKKRTRSEPSTEPPSEMKVRVVMDASPDAGTFYVNHAEVGRSKHEFYVMFGTLPLKPSQSQIADAKASGEIRIESLVQIQLPLTMIAGLIKAMSAQKDAYEAEHGPIRDDGSQSLTTSKPGKGRNGH